mmetsp:Transcript_40625/g.60248  ORF Transcript_40625/g.60248 Transcript_40625/m.60248 type:complete len:155 (+) Transcript_40625:453-917(+)
MRLFLRYETGRINTVSVASLSALCASLASGASHWMRLCKHLRSSVVKVSSIETGACSMRWRVLKKKLSGLSVSFGRCLPLYSQSKRAPIATADLGKTITDRKRTILVLERENKTTPSQLLQRIVRNDSKRVERSKVPTHVFCSIGDKKSAWSTV